MYQRKWLFAVSVLPCLALSLLAQAPAKDTPADGKVQVATHWSRWDYPKEVVVPEKSQLHLVEKGNTLWDLGQSFLGNPFAWPQIWEQNKWVKDPHWIYPGDPLIIPVAKRVVATTTGGPTDLPPEVAKLGPDRRQPKPMLDEYAFTFQDFIQLPYLAPKGAEAHFKELGAVRITDRQYSDRQFMGDGETVYLGQGKDKGLRVGDRLVVLKVKQRDLRHPLPQLAKGSLGDVVQQVGVARLTEVHPKGAVAKLERTLDSVEVGDVVAPFQEPANLKAPLRTDVANPIALQKPVARVLYARDNHQHTATGDMILIDQGRRHGLKVGDVLLSAKDRSWATESKGGTEQTTYYLGQVLVVKVEEASATCRILRASEEIAPGDIVTR